jgi:hypothetical protein
MHIFNSIDGNDTLEKIIGSIELIAEKRVISKEAATKKNLLSLCLYFMMIAALFFLLFF